MIRAMLVPGRPTLGACFQDLLGSRFLPKRTGRISRAEELPIRLQRCVRHLRPEYEWRAYGEAEHVFFSVARLRDAKSASPVMPSLEVFFLDANAAVYFAGVWECDPVHGWWLDSLVNLSYDSDHGWWLDAIADTNVVRDDFARLDTAVPLCAGKRPALRASASPIKASS